MKKDIHITIEDIIAREEHHYRYGQDVAIVFLQGEKMAVQNEKLLLNGTISFLFTRKGTACINVNGTECRLTENSILDILDTDIVQNMHLSPLFEGIHLLVSVGFVEETMRNTQKKEIGILLNRMDFLHIELTEREAGILQKSIEGIISQTERTEHLDHRELIKSYLKIFLLEFLNIAANRRKRGKREHSNREDVAARFSYLVNENCSEHHEVRWYADKLCIDMTYLSRILKRVNGKTANRWIDEDVTRKARLYLSDPGVTIKDIAEKLHFSDQAAFGKFFKKQEGLSPLNYRRAQLIKESGKE